MTCQQEPSKRLFAPEKISLIQLHLQFNQSFFHRNEQYIQSKTSSLPMLLRLPCFQLDLPSLFLFQWTFPTNSNWCWSCHQVLCCPPHQLPGSLCSRLPSPSGVSSWCRHTVPDFSCTTSSSHPECRSTCSPTPHTGFLFCTASCSAPFWLWRVPWLLPEVLAVVKNLWTTWERLRQAILQKETTDSRINEKFRIKRKIYCGTNIQTRLNVFKRATKLNS